MKNLSLVRAVSMFAALTLASFSSAIYAKDSSKPIIIPTHNWSSQIVMAHVIGKLFEKLGNNVEYKPADSQAVYESIRRGDITISHEVWKSTFGRAFYAAMKKGGIVDAGTHAAQTREEWWYPAYVADLCPGLPDWKALDKCADKFAQPDTAPKGRFLDGPQDWHGQETLDRIDALGMNFKAVFAGSAAALWAELDSAKKTNRPVVVFNWSPNFTDALYGGDFVKFPDYYDGCKKSAGGDGKCGSPPAAWLKKAAHYQMAKRWPAAYTLFTKVSFDNLQIATMAKLVDVDKLSHDKAADKWLGDNEKVWNAWMQ